jgi:hypothetical protein
MNGERREEKALHQGWWYVDLFGLLPPSLHVCILFMGQSFALLTQLDGVPCGANLTIVMKRGACNTASVNLLNATLRLLKKTSSRKDYQRRKKLDIEARSQTILQHKREDVLKLLQRRQAMIEEGTWKKKGGKDNMSHVVSILGDDSIGFGFSKIKLQASPTNDIFDWMTHYHPELLPPGDPFPPPPALKQAAVPEKKEVPSQPKTEFPQVPDQVTASIRTFLAIRRPGYSLFSLLDRSDDQKRAWLAHLTRKRHDETMERVCDVIIELEPQKYMTIQNVQDPPAIQASPDP